jgi:hypothetical protein
MIYSQKAYESYEGKEITLDTVRNILKWTLTKQACICLVQDRVLWQA